MLQSAHLESGSMKELMIIVPSRYRSDNVAELSSYVKEYSEISDLCFGFDNDDDTEYEPIPKVKFHRLPRMRIGGTLNSLARMYAKQYKYIAFMGDDHRPKTHGWDSKLVEPLRLKDGFSYGNDLLQGQALPTAIAMSSSIINTLGYMVPTNLKHFYFDNFWMDLGNATESLNYFDDVIIEHIHPMANKSDVDATYTSAWSVLSEDEIEYKKYLKKEFKKDIKKVLKLHENTDNRS